MSITSTVPSAASIGAFSPEIATAQAAQGDYDPAVANALRTFATTAVADLTTIDAASQPATASTAGTVTLVAQSGAVRTARGVGGAVTSVSVQALYRLGTEWVTGPTATVLGSDGASAAFDTMGHLCFFRVTALTLGAATTVTLNCTGWDPLPRETART